MKILDVDCGCDTRGDTLGEDNWWTGVTFGAAALILAMTYGGNVTAKTKNMLGIAAAGAILALIADKVINPTLKG